MGIREGHTAVVLNFDRILHRIEVQAATIPELFDELVALSVRFQFQKGFAFLGRNQIRNVFVEPTPVVKEQATRTCPRWLAAT